MRSAGATPRTRCTSLAESRRAPFRIRSNVHAMGSLSGFGSGQSEQAAETPAQGPAAVGQRGQPLLGLDVAGRELQTAPQAGFGTAIQAQFLLAPALHVPAVEALRGLGQRLPHPHEGLAGQAVM